MGWLGNDLDSIAALEGADLASAWTEIFAATMPEVAPSLLRRALAYERQERKFGGLPVVLRKQLESAATNTIVAMPEPPLKLKPGSRLMREWNGTKYSVLVTANGFDFAGRAWSSLTMIAQQITGSHQSGPRFFGLKRAKRS
ncbi:MAG: DUF2924 domain-containing protein [Novosphingobium sp.]|uniref:DUF2924 domain-containing protein n=1 Tax=Novosphingobium sp. TaxID=1874826 RepID=UPI003C7E9126